MFYVLKTMFVYKKDNIILFMANNGDILFSVPFIILGIVASFPIINIIKKRGETNKFIYFVESLLLIVILILSIMSLVSVKYNPFIYFKF